MGFSLREVAEMTGFSPNAVYTFLRRRGVEMRPPGQPKDSNVTPGEVFDATAELYRWGYTTNEIGAMLGLTHSSVAYRLRRAGIEMRSRHESLRIKNRRG